MWRENRDYSTPPIVTQKLLTPRVAFVLYSHDIISVMTNNLKYSGLNTSSNDPFDEMWLEAHPNNRASWEDDEEIPDHDEMNDVDE